MSDAVNRDQLKRLTVMSVEELLEKLGHDLADAAVDCLNQALTKHGGKTLVVDGEAHDMDDYIDRDKLHDVLTDARRLAEERGITRPLTRSIESVCTDDDAVRFVQGQ